MALLFWMKQQGLAPVALHVNYQQRVSAYRDEKIVRDFCSENQIDLIVYYPGKPSGNFQAWARKKRYQFFAAVQKATHAKALYTAHHEDDLLETYLMQKERGSMVDWYGMEPVSVIFDIEVRRPFLRRTKKDLLAYCEEHAIPYGLDETNFQDKYRRNQIRHKLVEPADAARRKAWIEAMTEDNDHLFQMKKEARRMARENRADEILDHPDAWLILDFLLCDVFERHLSRATLEDFVQKLKNKKEIQYKGIVIFTENNQIKAELPWKWIPFWIQDPGQLSRLVESGYSFGCFALSSRGKRIESLTLEEDDFPLTIRGFQCGDKIRMRYGTKSVSDFFTDRKIPRTRRSLYPFVENRAGNVIFASTIGCDVSHFCEKPDMYMLKLTPCNQN